MHKRTRLLTILNFNIFKIACYSSNIKMCSCHNWRTFEPFITKAYKLIRINREILGIRTKRSGLMGLRVNYKTRVYFCKCGVPSLPNYELYYEL